MGDTGRGGASTVVGIGAIILITMAVALFGPPLYDWMTVDACLDRGGRWMADGRACETEASPAQPDSSRFHPDRRAVLPPDRAVDLLAQCSRPAPSASSLTGSWTPTTRELDRADSLIALALDRALSDRAGPAPFSPDLRPISYRRQYAAIVLQGRRVLYVNGFHGGTEESWSSRGADSLAWRSHPVRVCDGGRGFFGAEVDVASGVLSPISFNDPG
jgi:hypothetical protein